MLKYLLQDSYKCVTWYTSRSPITSRSLSIYRGTDFPINIILSAQIFTLDHPKIKLDNLVVRGVFYLTMPDTQQILVK